MEESKCNDLTRIKNSLSKEIARGFLFATDAKCLWEELKDRFGESNSALIYQLKRDISNLGQESDFVVTYYTKLKGLWDHFACVKPRRRCTCCNCCRCDYNEDVAKGEEEDKIHQFLMGLNEDFKAITDQIIMLDPLSNLARVCLIVEKAEKQRVIKTYYHGLGQIPAMVGHRNVTDGHYDDGMQNSTMLARGNGYQKKNSTERTSPDWKCENCGKMGHFNDTCFKLKGFPDWFYEKRGKKPPTRPRFPHNANAISMSSSSNNNNEQIYSNHMQAGPSNYMQTISSARPSDMQGMIASLIHQ